MKLCEPRADDTLQTTGRSATRLRRWNFNYAWSRHNSKCKQDLNAPISEETAIWPTLSLLETASYRSPRQAAARVFVTRALQGKRGCRKSNLNLMSSQPCVWIQWGVSSEPRRNFKSPLRHRETVTYASAFQRASCHLTAPIHHNGDVRSSRRHGYRSDSLEPPQTSLLSEKR